jgi:hypothetical protein
MPAFSFFRDDALWRKPARDFVAVPKRGRNGYAHITTPPADIKRDRLLAAILLACSLASLLFPQAWPASLKFTLLTAGGLVATFLCPPLFKRWPVPRKHAPALGASAIVLSVFLLFAFIEGRVAFPAEAAYAFAIGMVGFAVVLFADHLRTL